jgi:hypothetical protein
LPNRTIRYQFASDNTVAQVHAIAQQSDASLHDGAFVLCIPSENITYTDDMHNMSLHAANITDGTMLTVQLLNRPSAIMPARYDSTFNLRYLPTYDHGFSGSDNELLDDDTDGSYNRPLEGGELSYEVCQSTCRERYMGLVAYASTCDSTANARSRRANGVREDWYTQDSH